MMITMIRMIITMVKRLMMMTMMITMMLRRKMANGGRSGPREDEGYRQEDAKTKNKETREEVRE